MPPIQVSEPGTLALMLAGAVGVAGVSASRRRRLRAACA